LNGTVSANGAVTTVTFNYGLTSSYGSNMTAAQSPLSPATAANAPGSAPVARLPSGMTYHFQVTPNNGTGGTILGTDQSLTTPARPAPTVTTNAASSVTATSATLNGTVTSNGAATLVNFNFGPTTAYGTSLGITGPNPIAATATGAAVSRTF